ncbi:MAG: prepilin-type N-terminal cleavage/methylation domain-containing protein [Xanthomonadales bacterium]|nr:prepilin-type N-terminal cleavage/methylation domain-containing protein [Xanthomonadales bacterium]
MSNGLSARARQRGVTLMEAMISLALSVVVTAAMVALMANSLGTASRIIQMSQLSDELRNTMSMLTRDVRRANYNPYAMYCYANPDCGLGADSSVTYSPDLNVVSYQSNDCLIYFLERNPPNGTPGTLSGGGFRLAANADNVGFIEMWAGDAAPGGNCAGDDDQWIAVTDPGFVDITTFAVDDDTESFTNTLPIEGGTSTLEQRARQVQIQIEGRLIRDGAITRRIEDTIKVRNDFISTS